MWNLFLISQQTLSTQLLKVYSSGSSYRWTMKNSSEITQLDPTAWLVITQYAHKREGSPLFIMAVSKEVTILSWQLSQETSTATNYHSIFLSALESHGLKRYLGKTVRQSTMLKCCFCIFKGRNKPFFHQVNHFILLYLIHKSFLFQHHKGKLPKYCWYRNSRLHIIIPIHMAYASHPLLESNSTSYIWNLRSSLSGKQVPWEGILSSK